MTTTQTPQPDAPVAPEKRCPRCGSAMAPDQEWCLACGAAAGTEVAEPRGWRVPIVLSGALALLAIIGVVLAIVALSGGKEELATATPTPAATVPTVSPAPTTVPTVTPVPTETPAGDATATTTPDPGATTTPDPNTDTGAGSSTFAGWPGGTGWTVIIESASTQSKAEKVATEAQGKGHTVGVLHSDDFSSLNPGYYVVFTEKYDSKSAAEDGQSAIKADYPDAYVRQVKQ